MVTYSIGDRVRLRDGMLSWITKRDGWTVEDAYDGYGLIREGGGVTVSVPWSDIEPDSPPIPPEPPRVVGQAWLDADGGLVQTDNAEGSPLAYILTGTESVVCWQDLAHPLTALYPVPNPDDDQAVEILCAYAALAHADATSVAPTARHVRAVLRALRDLRRPARRGDA